MAKAKGFKVGDHVEVAADYLASINVEGSKGTIEQVPVLAPEFLAKHEQFYSVRLESDYEPHEDEQGRKVFKHKKTSACRDHQTDAIGCVPESSLKPA